MYSIKYNLEPGDHIIEPIFDTGHSKHHAIFLGRDINGVEWIAENHKFNNVQVIPAAEHFATAKCIHQIVKFKGSNIERKNIVMKALSLAGKPYNLISYNCEHFVNEVLTGKPKSTQVKNAMILFLAIFLFGIIINDN